MKFLDRCGRTYPAWGERPGMFVTGKDLLLFMGKLLLFTTLGVLAGLAFLHWLIGKSMEGIGL